MMAGNKNERLSGNDSESMAYYLHAPLHPRSDAQGASCVLCLRFDRHLPPNHPAHNATKQGQ